MTAITQVRGTTWAFSIDGVGDLTGRTRLYFTLKRRRTDTDREALVQIEETDNLLYINGKPATTALNGTLTVTAVIDGDMDIVLADDETTKLSEMPNLWWDVKMLIASVSTQMDADRFNIGGVVTGAIV